MPGAALDRAECDGAGGQQWVQRTGGALLDPRSGCCLDSPAGATASGAKLRISDCNGTAGQRFPLM
ncbi:ricin-type beta-trefoil lectin domain protein [Actinacidiphila polyblastidii]|uniref:ricin-type beta-trefoil lectin domain protein n=1 Tax=Actinacidiphila polyblastidii TaxID=3110430 RepID=UPI0039BCE553